jgi:hypothetical protein
LRRPTSRRPPGRRAGLAALLLLAGCGPRDPCPHPRDLALDFRPGGPAASWVLVDPTAAEDALPLAGELIALAPAAGDGLVAGGWLSGPAGPKLWAATLDGELCVQRAWIAELGPAGARPSELVALPDGGLLAGGSAPGPGVGNDEAWVARFDGQGKPLWSVVEGEFLYVSGLFETPSRETVTAISLLPDGTIAAAGGADVNAALYSNWVMLLEADGRIRRRIDLPRDDPRMPGDLAAVVPQADGSLWLAGTLDPAGAEADAWVLAVAADSTLLWDRRYAAPGWQGVAAAAHQGPALLLAGARQAGGGRDAWLARLDGEGEMVLSQSLRGAATGDGGLLAVAPAGGDLLVAGAAGGAWLLRLDDAGRPLASSAQPGAGRLGTVLQLPDGRALGGGRAGAAGPPLLVLLAPPAS